MSTNIDVIRYPWLDVYTTEYIPGDRSTHIKNYVLYASMIAVAALCLLFRKKAAHIITVLGPALFSFVIYRLLSVYLASSQVATLVIPTVVAAVSYVLIMAATSIMPYIPLSLMISFTIAFAYYNVITYLKKFETLYLALGAAAFGGTFLFSLMMFVLAGDMPWTVHRLIHRRGAIRSYFNAIMDCVSDVSMNIKAVQVPVPYVEVEPSYLTRLYVMFGISAFVSFLLTSGSFFFSDMYLMRFNAFSVGLTTAAGQYQGYERMRTPAKNHSIEDIVLMNSICWGALTLAIMFIRSTMFDGLMSMMFQAAQRRRGMHVKEQNGAYSSAVTTPTRTIDHGEIHEMPVVHRV